MEVKVKKMTTYEISDDGEAVTLNFVDEADRPASLRLQIPDLGNLSMTLPSLIEAALRRRHREGACRYAYPMGSWSIEQAIDPATGAIAGVIDRSARAYRWLFSFLHDYDLPVLLRNQPARDIVVWLLSIAGLIVSVTGVVVGYRTLARRSR